MENVPKNQEDQLIEFEVLRKRNEIIVKIKDIETTLKDVEIMEPSNSENQSLSPNNTTT
jgi:chaperonin cofactor prefoldin